MNDGKEKRRRQRGGSGTGSGKNSRNRNRKNDSSDSESEELPEAYQSISIQLLDLMHTLHTRTAQIFRWWAEEGGALPQCSALWSQGWCPLLQGIARLATDQRRQVRTSAITCLQRALLVQDLQTLTGLEWAGCFKQVLFPLLSELLNEKPAKPADFGLLEESRMRTATIMSKVFLHHLNPLIGLAGFNELWLEILDYFERFMKIGSDMLYEAVLESLKNMLLVMHSVCVFHNSDGVTHSTLWDVTWQRISGFLPNLKDELFKSDAPTPKVVVAAVPSVQPAPPPVDPAPSPAPAAPVQPSIILQPPQAITGGTPSSSPSTIRIPTGGPPTSNLLIENNTPLELPQVVPAPVPIPVQLAELVPSSLPVSPVLQVQTTTTTMTPPQQISLEGSPASINTNRYSNIIELPVTPSPPPEQVVLPTPEQPQPDPPQVPLSHLVGGNQYPSLQSVPIGIAQSFAPIFVQPNANPAAADGADIYSDYINDPYNLTLQIDSGSQEQQQQSVPASQQQPPQNVFQSANYFQFGTGRIPPGSEMLFGEP